MSDIAIKFEDISKQYRLGTVGTGTISHDLNRWWHVVRGKEDPYLKIGEVNDRSIKTKSGYVWALQGISFEVKQGDVVGIIGKNGAGKSTLLKLLSRVTAPTTGMIKAKGRIGSLLEVGTGFHPELTGRENIYMNGTIMGMTKDEISSKLDEIIDFAGVEKYIDTPTKRYSSGMTVRLGFAIAAHLEPEILVVDEVLAVGDIEFQKKAIGKLRDVSTGQGRTVLFVSHNMASIRSLCKTGILLNNGTIANQGDIHEIVQGYNDLFLDSDNLIFENKFPIDKSLKAQFLEASINNPSKNLSYKKVIDVFEPLTMRLKFIVREKITGTTPVLWLKKDDIDLCWSFASDNIDGMIENGIEPGEYTYEVPLPTPLKKGIYTCRLQMGKLRVTNYHVVKEAIRFSVDDLSFDPTNKSYTGNRVGIVPTNLVWKRL